MAQLAADMKVKFETRRITCCTSLVITKGLTWQPLSAGAVPVGLTPDHTRPRLETATDIATGRIISEVVFCVGELSWVNEGGS